MQDLKKLSDYIYEIEDQSKKRRDLIDDRELKINAMLLSMLKSLKDIAEKRVRVNNYIDFEEEFPEPLKNVTNYLKDTDEIFRIIEDLCKEIIEIRKII
jgi:hypothetical protein